MRAYVIRRILLIIPTLFLTTIVIFLMIRMIPGDVIDVMAGEMGGGVDAVSRAELMHQLGLDLPIHIQYAHWIGGILQGDLGDSLRKGTPVLRDIADKWPVTFELGIMALIIAQIIAIPIGIYSALRQDTRGDYIARSFAIICIAVPSFWLGTMVVVFPSIWWGYSPPLALIPITEDFVGNFKQFIIPAIVLGMSLSGTTMRLTRTMMLEVLRQDYIRTAWAKGLRERVVVVRHALKNALIPVVTMVGLQLAILVGGTVIIEQIFCLPGMGRLIIDSTFQRDYTVVSGVMLVFAVVMLVINLIVDLTYSYLDPRIRYK
jgi:peptide/nickel transport system permease protein